MAIIGFVTLFVFAVTMMAMWAHAAQRADIAERQIGDLKETIAELQKQVPVRGNGGRFVKHGGDE